MGSVLRNTPKEYIHTSWKYINKIKKAILYLFNEKKAGKYIMSMIYSLRYQFNHKKLNKYILEKHSSRAQL